MDILNDCKEQYDKERKLLAYGADIHEDYDVDVLKEWGLTRNEYYLLVARLEPENNLSMAVEGYKASREYGNRPLIIVGKTDTPYGKKLVEQYGGDPNVRFVGGIYDFDKLNSLRHFSFAYIHGHSVGGTNPSLLEAMASGCFILAHDNVFNRAVLGDNAIFYGSSLVVTMLLNTIDNISRLHREEYVKNNLEVIRKDYSWERLVEEHEKYFRWMISNKTD